MKTISNVLTGLASLAAFILSAQFVQAQGNQPEVGFVRIVDAVQPGEGKVNFLIDGEDIFPKGYNLGQKTGGLGIKAGAHTITLKKTGVVTGTTKINLGTGETLSLIGFGEKVPPKPDAKPEDPPVWEIKILRLKQSDPESGYRLAFVPLCPQDELKIETESSGKAKPPVYAKRMLVTSMDLGKSKSEVLVKIAGEIVTVVSPEDRGNYVVIFYLDEAGKVKALNFYDPKFVVAG